MISISGQRRRPGRRPGDCDGGVGGVVEISCSVSAIVFPLYIVIFYFRSAHLSEARNESFVGVRNKMYILNCTVVCRYVHCYFNMILRFCNHR